MNQPGFGQTGTDAFEDSRKPKRNNEVGKRVSRPRPVESLSFLGGGLNSIPGPVMPFTQHVHKGGRGTGQRQLMERTLSAHSKKRLSYIKKRPRMTDPPWLRH